MRNLQFSVRRRLLKLKNLSSLRLITHRSLYVGYFMLRATAALVLSLAITGCAAQAPIALNSAGIQNGMTASEVTSIMGAPKNRQFSGDNEAWQYCATDMTGFAGDQYVLIWLYKNRVSGLETYTNTLMGSCETYFRQISFEDAPDSTVEVRYR